MPWGEQIRQRGNEFGAVTGRPRRCGWFDAPLLRYTAVINGFDSLVVTKLDVLDEFEKIPVCVGYRRGRPGGGRDAATVAEMETIEPVYECLPGWRASTFGISSYDELPAAGQGLPGVSREAAPAWKWAASPPGPSATRPS